MAAEKACSEQAAFAQCKSPIGQLLLKQAMLIHIWEPFNWEYAVKIKAPWHFSIVQLFKKISHPIQFPEVCVKIKKIPL